MRRGAPGHLSAYVKAWRKAMLAEYEFAEPELALLDEGCEALDRARAAAEVVRRDGMTTTDRYGGIKAHPCCALERDARATFVRICRELGVREPADEEPVPGVTRLRGA